MFRDNNENGVPDGGDDMLPNMTVYLTDRDENDTYDTRTTNSSGASGLGASFVRVESPETRDILILRTNLNNPLIPAGMNVEAVTGSGHIDRANILFNNQWHPQNYPLAVGEDAIRRLGLHEGGHVHGLGDVTNSDSRPADSSVMLTDLNRRDRFYARIPDQPTQCDRDAARNASF